MTEVRGGRYEIEQVVGGGGQGWVARARDRRLGRVVALKVRPVTDEVERANVLDEARAMLAIPPHQGLPTLREEFFDGDAYYLVSDWIEGRSVEEVLRDTGRPGLAAPAVAALIARVAEALHHLHSAARPVVHGDVKPSNILITDGGTPVLVDFGIARLGDAGRGVGSRGYAAPEITAGDVATPAADVFGLAATAFTLLAGASPTGDEADWRLLSRRGSGRIQRVIRRALSFDPDRRPSALEFATEFGAAVRDARPTGFIALLEVVPASPRHEEMVAEHGGWPAGEGTYVFERVEDAAGAAVACRSDEVRCAVHAGDDADPDGTGPLFSTVWGLRMAAPAGRILLSAPAAARLSALPPRHVLRSIGEVTLADLSGPVGVFELAGPAEPATKPATIDAARNNLAAAFTSFVGRRSETERVLELLGAGRMVTVTGAGGLGKTRIAMRAAAAAAPIAPAGVWVVDIAPLPNAETIAYSAAAAIGVTPHAGDDAVAAVESALAGDAVLLVLDNCETQIDGAAAFAERLLRACPRLRVLATSREPLRIPGEVVAPVGPLAADAGGARLLLERGAEHAAAPPDAGIAAEIARRLDGIPLAIELAAAALYAMPAADLLARIDERFSLLTKGVRTAPPRHRTLEALIESGYELLDDAGREVFRRLGAFAGSFSVDGAAAVAGIDHDGADAFVRTLTDRSLLSRQPAARFRLLETIRIYALERLRESGEEEPARLRQVAWLERLVREATRRFMRDEPAAWLDIEAEIDNIRDAIRWGTRSAHPDRTLGLAGAMGEFWRHSGRWREGLGLIELLLRAGPHVEHDEATLAEARCSAAQLAWRLGRLDDAGGYATSALELRHVLTGDLRIVPLLVLGNVATIRGAYPESRAWYSEGLAVTEPGTTAEAALLGNISNTLWLEGDLDAGERYARDAMEIWQRHGHTASIAIQKLGQIATLRGDYTTGHAQLLRALEIDVEHGFRAGIAFGRMWIARSLAGLGDRAGAARSVAEAVELFGELSDPMGRCAAIEMAALVAAEAGDPATAGRLLGAADTERLRIGSDLWRFHQWIDETVSAGARDAEAFERARDAGRSLPLDRAVALALETMSALA